MAGQTVVCPHCGLETKLFIPQTPKIRKTAELEQPKPQPTIEKSEESNAVALSYVFSFLLPNVGFFFGVYLMAKKKAGHGAACMALSIVMSAVWLQIFSLKNNHTESQVNFLAKYSDLQTDEILHPAQEAYGWILGDKLPDNFDVSTSDGEITYYSSYSETNGFDGWLTLTEDRRIASITQCFNNESNQIDESVERKIWINGNFRQLRYIRNYKS